MKRRLGLSRRNFLAWATAAGLFVNSPVEAGGLGFHGASVVSSLSFIPQTVERSALAMSNTQTWSGLSSVARVKNGMFSINGGRFTGYPTIILTGQTYQLQAVASDVNSTARSITCSIGGTLGTWTVTTVASDTLGTYGTTVANAAITWGLKTSNTTGSMTAGLNLLTVANATGFANGDHIIVSIGGEAGAGALGTKGVGGVLLPPSYASTAAMNADTTPAGDVGSFCWIDNGTTFPVYRWSGSAWVLVTATSADFGEYLRQIQPKALLAVIDGISGNVLTLKTAVGGSPVLAVVNTDNAQVYFDNVFPLEAATHSATLSNTRVNIPAGNYAISSRWMVNLASNVLIKGAGKGTGGTRFFCPKGTKASDIRVEQGTNVIMRDFAYDGGVLDGTHHGIAWGATGTLVGHAQGFDLGVWGSQCTSCQLLDIKSNDGWYSLVGFSAGFTNIIARCDVILTTKTRYYRQWMVEIANETNTEIYHTTVTSPSFVSGMEQFGGSGVWFRYCTGYNASINYNNCSMGGLENPRVEVAAGSIGRFTSTVGSDFYPGSDHSCLMFNENAGLGDGNLPRYALPIEVLNPICKVAGPTYDNGAGTTVWVVSGLHVTTNFTDFTVVGQYIPGASITNDADQFGLIQMPSITPLTALNPCMMLQPIGAKVRGMRFVGAPRNPNAAVGGVGFGQVLLKPSAAAFLEDCIGDSINREDTSATYTGLTNTQTNAAYVAVGGATLP